MNRGVALGVRHDRRGDVDLARALDAFEAGRAVDLEDARATAPLEHVDARHLEAHHLGRADGRVPVAPRQAHAVALSATVQVRSELARLRHTAHRGDDTAADDDG